MQLTFPFRSRWPVRFLSGWVLCSLGALAQPDASWKVHDWERPRPSVVDPGVSSGPGQPGRAPSDAVVLFDGADLSAWCSMDGGVPQWVVREGAMECVQGSGYIRTLQNFGDCQLHVEWSAPVPPEGSSQGRGNSGVFLMGLYEVQILDSWENLTYADGQAGSVYGQIPPLVNASRPPGQWQTYDIVFNRPHFGADGNVSQAARLTLFHNGVLVQNHVALTGPTGWMERAAYKPHPPKLPLSLQDHGNPVRFRNIWVRELTDAEAAEFTYSRALLDRYVQSYRGEGIQLDFMYADEQVPRPSQLQIRLIHLNDPNRRHVHPVYAASPTRFVARAVDAHLTFRTNRLGEVEGLTFHIAGEDRELKAGPWDVSPGQPAPGR